MTAWSADPFIDWDHISAEMARDLYVVLRDLRSTQDEFLAIGPYHPGLRRKAAEVLQIQYRLGRVVEDIRSALYVMPMVVHVAGRRESAYEDGQEQMVQRCRRCGSMLQLWMEGFRMETPDGLCPVTSDDMEWWPENASVAKSADEHGRHMYRIDGRELRDYERPCPDLTTLGH